MIDHGYNGPAPAARYRRMYFVDQTMAVPGGFTPSILIEDDPYYYPLAGRTGGERATVWGPDLDTAKAAARSANHDLGLSEEDEMEIMRSVLAAVDKCHIFRDGEGVVSHFMKGESV